MDFILNSVQKDVTYSGFHGYHDHHGQALNMPVTEQKYMIGVELETVFPSAGERRSWCNACKSNWFYMEEDGSLPSAGCEFITTPLAPRDAKNPDMWKTLIKALREANVRSYGTSSTGLHVHISRTIFGSDVNAVGRLVYMYYYVLDPETRRKIFGRSNADYARDLDKSRAPKTSAVNTLKVALKYKEVRDEIAKELCDVSTRNRYYSINLQNTNTVEFRQGKGTVNNVRIAAICEFAEAMCLYVKRNVDLSRYTEADFLATLAPEGVCKSFYLNNEQ